MTTEHGNNKNPYMTGRTPAHLADEPVDPYEFDAHCADIARFNWDCVDEMDPVTLLALIDEHEHNVPWPDINWSREGGRR